MCYLIILYEFDWLTETAVRKHRSPARKLLPIKMHSPIAPQAIQR
jgi:hypothetical protein